MSTGIVERHIYWVEFICLQSLFIYFLEECRNKQHLQNKQGDYTSEMLDGPPGKRI